ncbi:MAG: 1-acyl-sn-glycerol-3-phosphate acyltransferase [Chthonomonas sp.]|nr:1-acyl-sn-glycerol-3-phosphate acyltransferase [Chthonomonas sp.]
MKLGYRLVVGIARGLFWVLGAVRVRGSASVPDKGAVLIVANHRSDCDPPVVQIATPRHVHFMAKSELFEMPSVGWFLRWWQAFPVKRGAPDRGALREAINRLKAGHCVCIFPEGQLSATGLLQEVLPGAMLVARQAGVPMVCLGLQGTNRVMPYGSLVPRPSLHSIRAEFGDRRMVTNDDSNEELALWVEGELKRLTGETLD